MSVRYGISAVSPEQVTSLPAKMPEHLRMVEFPGDVLDTAGGCQKLEALSRNGVLLRGRDFITPEIAGLIPEENSKLRAELEFHFSSRCLRAAELGVRSFSVAFDLFHAMAETEYGEKLAAFLRRCAGVIFPLKQRMRLVCRIPGSGEWEKILAFRNALMLPDIDLLLELHPHEPNAMEIMRNALRTFRLHDDCRRVCYDSGSGNVLTPGALRRCSESASRDLERECRIFFAPGGGRFDAVRLGELNALAGVPAMSEEKAGSGRE